MDEARPHPVSAKRRWPWVVGAVMVVLGVLLAGAQPFITRKIAGRIESRLAVRELAAEWESMTWTPWRGVHFKELAVRRLSGEPLGRVDNLAVRFPLFGKGATGWSIRNATLVLNDSAGAVALAGVDVDASSRSGEFRIEKLQARVAGLTAQLNGRVAFQPQPAPEPVTLDLRAVRGVLGVLEIKEDSGPFRVSGDFEVDARQEEISWTSRLKGEGGPLVWKGVPLEKAAATAELGSRESTIGVRLETRHGSTKASLTRTGWGDGPFNFKGNLRDSAGRADEYAGTVGDGAFEIERLRGDANLLEIAADFPALRSKLPEEIAIRGFPKIEVRGLRGDFSAEKPVWSLESLTLKEAAVLTAEVRGRELKVTGLRGQASYRKGGWRLANVRGGTLGGSFSLSGNVAEAGIRGGWLEVESLSLGQVKRLVGASKKVGTGELSGTYRGAVDFGDGGLDGEGSVRLEGAPVFDVPLLAPVFEIFMALVPGVERADEGRFDVRFSAKDKKIHVSKFEATGGTLTVTAEGTVNLATRRADGVARGKLTGLPGVVTKPLSRLLEMEVAGPLDDIRVKPLGPAKLASNAASATVGVPVDAVEDAGKIARDVLIHGAKAPFRWFRRDDEE